MNDLATKDWGLEADTAELAVEAISMMEDPLRMLNACMQYNLRAVYDSGWGLAAGYGVWDTRIPELKGTDWGWNL